MATTPTLPRNVWNRTREQQLVSGLRVANTFRTRLVGLLFTSGAKFRAGDGIWINPSQGIHTFGMTFSIDVLYLNKSLQVIHLVEALRPWRIAAIRFSCRSVLELPAGTIAATGTQVGDFLAMDMK